MKLTHSIRSILQNRLQRWLTKRIPETHRVDLNHRNLFILPTRTGVAYLGFLVLLWLVATNYENNLIFAITFFLTALFVTGIHHTHATLSGISVVAHKSHPAFCGENSLFEIALSHKGKRRRDSIQLSFSNVEKVFISLAEQQIQGVAQVKVETDRRGWFDPGRLTIESQYPLGLFRVWSHIKLDARVLVYPRPIVGEGARYHGQVSDDGRHTAVTGSEDFIGLDKYQNGQSLRHVAWKHYAREQGFLTKYFGDYQDHRLWLDWDAFPGLDREARLSRLCGLLLEISRQEVSYGLRIPGILIQPNYGTAHQLRVLRELALFEVAEHPPQVNYSHSAEVSDAA